jgi:hypothetical protein
VRKPIHPLAERAGIFAFETRPVRATPQTKKFSRDILRFLESSQEHTFTNFAVCTRQQLGKAGSVVHGLRWLSTHAVARGGRPLVPRKALPACNTYPSAARRSFTWRACSPPSRSPSRCLHALHRVSGHRPATLLEQLTPSHMLALSARQIRTQTAQQSWRKWTSKREHGQTDRV